jgi:hypothetical protein
VSLLFARAAWPRACSRIRAWRPGVDGRRRLVAATGSRSCRGLWLVGQISARGLPSRMSSGNLGHLVLERIEPQRSNTAWCIHRPCHLGGICTVCTSCPIALDTCARARVPAVEVHRPSNGSTADGSGFGGLKRMKSSISTAARLTSDLAGSSSTYQSVGQEDDLQPAASARGLPRTIGVAITDIAPCRVALR